MNAFRDHWLIYALGGGLGHLTRAIALSRAVLRKSSQCSVDVLTNSAIAHDCPVKAELGPRGQVIALDHQLPRDELAKRVLETIEANRFKVFVVDTFPRGLVGELASVIPRLTCTKVLVQRDLNPRYVQSFNLQTTVEHFDVVLLPGEDAPFHDERSSHRTEPWLIRDCNELLSISLAGERLEIHDRQLATVVVVGCGRDKEQDEYCQLATRLTKELSGCANVRYVTLRDILPPGQRSLHFIRAWPLLEFLPAVDLVVGAGGYNTVNETRATRTPLVAISRPRMYDRQFKRLRRCERAVNLNDLHRRVLQFAQKWRSMRRHQSCLIPYTNGVHDAVSTIESFSARLSK